MPKSGEFYTFDEVLNRLKIDANKLKRLVSEGEIRAFREGDTMKSWVEPLPTTHIWEAPLPDGLQPGVHTITVRAIDDYGHRHTEHKLFEIYALAPVETAVD